MWDRSNASISEASAFVNRIPSRTHRGEHEQPADDRDVLEEVRRLIEDLRSLVGPETMRDRRRDDYVECQRPRCPAGLPAYDDHDAADELEDNRQPGRHLRHGEFPFGEVIDRA